jgi:TonB-linked SusC/RagA family outer membrane protein
MLLSVAAYAQKRTVTGTVKDGSGLPAIGITVLEQGTQNGTVTDADGRYSITVAGAQSVLSYEALGYSTVTETVGSRSVIDVTVLEEALELDAVVAIGYGSVRKKDLTTAVSIVSTEDAALRPVTEASGLIQGKVAGVQVQQTSGLPGSGMVVRVRGNSSIASSNDPLYVVDGVPVGEGSYAIAYLSPNDIETMQILKDASSAAIYGSRAANGVVLITTKQGSRDKAPTVNFSSYVGISKVTRSFDVMNTEEYRDYAKEFNVNIPADVTDQTDWFKETYQNAITQNYQVGVSGGTDKIRYYMGAGYNDEQGILKVAFSRRYNVRANFDVDMFKWLTVGTNIAYSNYKNNGIISGTGANRAGVVLSVINTPTYAVIWDPENPNQYYNKFYGLAGYTTPLENMARSENNYDTTDRMIMSAYAQINFSKHLNFKSTVSMDRRWVHSWSFLDPVKTDYGRTQHGNATDTRSDDRRMVYDNILTYNNTFGEHHLEAMAGTSATTSDWMQLSGSRSYFNPEYYDAIWGLGGGNNGGLRGQSTGWAQWAIMSYLGRVAYNYASKYYLTVNFRADGSSKLAPGHKWGYFPSASAAWRISGEDFLKDNPVLSDLKLRVGWGQQGNQSGLGDYAWVQTYNTNYYDWTKDEYAEAVPTLGTKSNWKNESLTWETTTQTNVGVDASLWGGRLGLVFDAYYKYTRGMLMSVAIPNQPNLTRNEGEMSNWGLEFALNSVNIAKKDFEWSTDFNISMNRNRLEKLALRQVYYYVNPESIGENIVRMEPGHPLSQFWGYTAKGVDPETGLVIYDDLVADGKINDSDKHYIGDANPDFIFGLTNNFRYKGLTLSFLITGSYGNDIYNVSKIDMIGMKNAANQLKDAVNRWRVPGMVTDIPKAGEAYNIKSSTMWIEDGSYLKVKNITLSYDINSAFLRRYDIGRVQPYVTLANMLTLTRYSGYDPEMSQYASATNMGIDYGTYPNVKTVTFGVNVDFGGGHVSRPASRIDTYVPERVVEKEVIKEVVKEVPVEVIREVPARSAWEGSYDDDVYFVIGKAEIRPDEAFKLGRIARILEENPEARITITGYADSATGNSEINEKLSRQRAAVVVEMLKKAGISADRISYSATGTDRDPSARPESNRVAVCIVK